jgi:Protein of unknown function (DUF2905)
MSRALIIVGLAVAAVGLLWPWIGRLGLGGLPGDIFIQREGFSFYAPITTGVLVSVVLSLILCCCRVDGPNRRGPPHKSSELIEFIDRNGAAWFS